MVRMASNSQRYVNLFFQSVPVRSPTELLIIQIRILLLAKSGKDNSSKEKKDGRIRHERVMQNKVRMRPL